MQLENLAIDEVEASSRFTRDEVKEQVVNLYNRIEILIKSSPVALSNEEKDRVIREEMETETLPPDEFDQTYRWLNRAFLTRTL